MAGQETNLNSYPPQKIIHNPIQDYENKVWFYQDLKLNE